MLRLISAVSVCAAATPASFKSQYDAKPIDQMTFSELLTTGKESLNNITMIPHVKGNVHVTRLQEVLKAVCKLGYVFWYCPSSQSLRNWLRMISQLVLLKEVLMV